MIAPIEIENKEFKKVLRGYKEEEVDEFLDLVKEDYEQLYRENAELKEKVRLYQDQINKYENIEETLNATLITAQRAAEDTCNAANKKARIIVEEADLKARQVIEQANNSVIEIRKEYDLMVKEFKVFRNKFKSLIKDQMDTIDEIFCDVDESCEIPFRECSYMKEDIDDTAELFTEEVEVEPEEIVDNIILTKDDDDSAENVVTNK